MRRNIFLALALAVFATGLTVAIWRRNHARAVPQTPSLPTEQTQANTNPVVSNSPIAQGPATSSTPASLRNEKLAKLAAIQAAANVPIVFYGKILNQFNQPVSGVRVDVAYNYWGMSDIINVTAHRYTNVFYSDAGGMFVVKDITGQAFDLFFENKGIEIEPRSERSFSYGGPAQHSYVNAANPKVYRVWQRQGAANLVRWNSRKTVRADGTPLSLNLKNRHWEIGATNSAGPVVRVWRQPLYCAAQTSSPTNWQYELTFPGGELQFTDDIFCYAAPESGYQPKLRREFAQNTSDYSYRDEKRFYFITKEGKFGSGSLEIWSDYEGDVALVILSVSWNPDGSRNLEPPE